ncbi:cytosolic carboxypeptidase 1 isoform X2 [Bemisia tabaci]
MMTEDAVVDGLVHRLRQCGQKPSENIDVVRTTASRLLSRVTASDKNIKEKTLERMRRKKDDSLGVILNLLEAMRDQTCVISLTAILHACVHGSPKSGAAVKQMIDCNGTVILTKLLISLQAREPHTCDSFLHPLISILSQISQKDQKFASKVRLINGVKTFHHFLRTYTYNHNKLLLPNLLIIRTLVLNNATSNILVKDGIVQSLEKILLTIGYSPSLKLRIIMNIYCCLSRSNLFCAIMVKLGHVPLLLEMFRRWDRFDGKMRLRTTSFTLLTLQHICLTKTGRNAIRANNGFAVLYKFCVLCPEDKLYDSLLSRVCAVINMCLERRDLPVPSLYGPYRFNLRNVSSSFQKSDFGSMSEESDSSDEDDEDEELEVENELLDGGSLKKTRRKSSGLHQVPLLYSFREFDQLQIYKKFFEEFYASPTDGSIPTDNSAISRQNSGISIGPPSNKIKSAVNIPFCDKIFTSIQGINCKRSFSSAYCTIANRVNSVNTFVKVAYPDMIGGKGAGLLEPLHSKDRNVCRTKLQSSVERGLNADRYLHNIVYDLDELAAAEVHIRTQDPAEMLCNKDIQKLGVKEPGSTARLRFESRFESGNLRKAIQVGTREYDLILTPDINSTSHHQWFYFEVSNMEANSTYVFNIVNCLKSNSQFNFGMKPLLFSVKEATLGRPGWRRIGTDICYYRNSYRFSNKRKKTYFTATFSFKFPHALDVCYFAYHFPYTYSLLLTQIWKWTCNAPNSSVYIRVDNLCSSLKNNQIPLITVSALDTPDNLLINREVIFLTSRVHPGESNASWVIDGLLEFLVSDSLPAVKLREKYILKIIPMLNVDGVINGCHRCGLTDEDLNRRWINPDPVTHSVIYHAKGLLEFSAHVLKKVPFVYCDFHGHSRRKNVFMYGCSPKESWLEADRESAQETSFEYLVLSHSMQKYCSAFSLPSCHFRVERSRESTARITVWREFGIQRSYTLEASYCGCDQGVYKGYHFDTLHLLEIGANFGVALSTLAEETVKRLDGFDTRMIERLVKETSPGFSNEDGEGSKDEDSDDDLLLDDDEDDDEESHRPES